MALLEFARGPALVFSLIVLVLGLAWRLDRIFGRPVRAIFAKMLPPKGVKIRVAQMINAQKMESLLELVAEHL